MNNKIKQELLQDPKIVDEINKHRWYESERKGCDVGFEYASEDWFNRYSTSWIKHNVCKKGLKSWFSNLFPIKKL